MQEDHKTMTSEVRLFKAVARARVLIQEGQAVPGAAISMAVNTYSLDPKSEHTVARHALRAVRACEAAREAMWYERQRRRAVSDDTESSIMASSLSRFDYA